jgi:hypothetical protein
MMKKSKRQTFSYLRRESSLEKQGVKFDSLLARGCRQGVKALFQHPVRTKIRTLFKRKKENPPPVPFVTVLF